MDEASNTCIEALQLVQVRELKVVEIAAGLGESDTTSVHGFQHSAHVTIAKNVPGFAVAILSTATFLFRHHALQAPLATHTPSLALWLQPNIKFRRINRAFIVANTQQKPVWNQEMAGKGIRISLFTVSRI